MTCAARLVRSHPALAHQSVIECNWTSVVQLQRELNLARIAGGGADAGEVRGVINLLAREAKIGVIDGIEELASEGQFETLAEIEVLVETEVDASDAGRRHDVASGVTELTGRREGKGGGIEPALDGLMTHGTTGGGLLILSVGEVVGVTDDLGAGDAGIGGRIGRVVVAIDSEVSAGLEGLDAGEFPAAEDQVRRTVPIGAELAAVAEGKVILPTGGEALTDIEARVSPIDIAVVAVAEAIPEALIAGHRAERRFVDRIRPGVAAEEHESATQALFHLRLERVVLASRLAANVGQHAEIGVGTA